MSTPIITGQQTLSTAINVNLLVTLSDLFVSDSTYPDGSGTDWIIDVLPGAHYTIDTSSANEKEFTVYPASNFMGTLTVPVRVKDDSGPDVWSDYFNLTISVIGMPMITGQTNVPKMYVGSYLTVGLLDLIVTTDKPYPGLFTFAAMPGANFSIVSSTTTSVLIIITGSLSSVSVPVVVNDGTLNSNTFNYMISIVAAPKSKKPASFSINTSTPKNPLKPF